MPTPYASAVESVELLRSLDSVATLLRVVCDLSGLRVATVAEVTEDRWVACAVHDRMDFGLLPGAELELESTLCNHVRSSHESVIIADVERSLTYCDHPAPRLYGWKSYVSVPIFRPNGTFFGTLCALDSQPQPQLEQRPVAAVMEGYATLIGELILQEERRRDETPGPRSDADLQALREQLLVLFDQDLRVHLQSLALTAESLAEQIPAVRAWHGTVEQLAQRSADAADFIRAQLGSGLPLKLAWMDDMNDRLDTLLSQLRDRYPRLTFSAQLPALSAPLRLDAPRLLQALHAVLEQAAAQSAPGQDIRLSGAIHERAYRLRVEDDGVPLQPAELDQLFQPRIVESGSGSPTGLDLRLYLAQEIVRGHGGTLTASTVEGHNRFTLNLPTALD